MSNLIPSFVSAFDSDIDDLFRSLIGSRPALALKRGNLLPSRNAPLANISRTDEGYAIELATPGFSRDDFHVDVENNTLTVTCTAYGTNEEKRESSYSSREFNCSSFSRSWSLPEGVNAENISANYEAGILNIGIPVEASQKKKYAVTVE